MINGDYTLVISCSLVDSNELTLTPSGAMAELLKVFGSNIPPSEYKSNVQEIAGGMKLSDSSINTFHWFGWRSEKFSGREARLTATFMFFNTVPVNSDSFGFRIGSGEIKNDFLRSCMVEQGCNASYTLKFESSNQVLFEFIHGKQTQNFQVTGFKLEFLPGMLILKIQYNYLIYNICNILYTYLSSVYLSCIIYLSSVRAY